MNATERLQARYEAALMPNYGIPPLALARGEGCRVWDADGHEYTDLFAGIAVSSLGHAHPAIIDAVSRQVRNLAHTSNLFLHEGEVALAERLLSLLARHRKGGRVFFANSGTEANEAAIKLVRRFQGPDRPVFVAAENGFHGRTMGALALTGKSSIREPFGPFGFTRPVRAVRRRGRAARRDQGRHRRGVPGAGPRRRRRGPAAIGLPAGRAGRLRRGGRAAGGGRDPERDRPDRLVVRATSRTG